MTRRRHAAVVFVLLLVLGLAVAALTVPPDADADDTCSVTWNGGAGSWTDPTRWTPARVPTAGDDACVVRAPGAAPVAVRLATPATVAGVILRGATLRLGTAATLQTTRATVSGAVLAGPGALRGGIGIVDLRDSRLAGIHVTSAGRLTLGGRLTFTGGTTVDGGFADLVDGLRIGDGDGDAANHLGLSRFPLYVQGRVSIGVRLGLTDVGLLAQGDVVLERLDALDATGRLQNPDGSDLELGVSSGGSLTLPRTITAIGTHTTVYAADAIRTPDGGDALGGIGRVDGTLTLVRTLVAGGTVVVRGQLTSGATLVAPVVRVQPGGVVDVDRVTGALVCGGQCLLAGSRVGALTLLPGSRPSTDLAEPVTVDGRASLGGDLTVAVTGRGLQPGDTLVLLTAARGVSGTFASVTTDRRGRTVTPDYRPTHVLGTLGTAP